MPTGAVVGEFSAQLYGTAEMFADNADPMFYNQFAQSGISRSLGKGLTKELQDSGIALKDGTIDLLKAIDAQKEQQAALLRDFVSHWYAELKRPSKDELWWYIYGDPEKHPLSMGSYFGRWCLEAVAVVKAFGLDDSLCLGHEHYPGDLLRPDGPSTHLPRPAPRQGLWTKLFGRR